MNAVRGNVSEEEKNYTVCVYRVLTDVCSKVHDCLLCIRPAPFQPVQWVPVPALQPQLGQDEDCAAKQPTNSGGNRNIPSRNWWCVIGDCAS